MTAIDIPKCASCTTKFEAVRTCFRGTSYNDNDYTCRTSYYNQNNNNNNNFAIIIYTNE